MSLWAAFVAAVPLDMV